VVAHEDDESAADRKRRHNAPKLLKKVERKIAALEAKVALLDEDLVAAGSDVGRCLDLAKTRDLLQRDLGALYADYEALDALVVGQQTASLVSSPAKIH